MRHHGWFKSELVSFPFPEGLANTATMGKRGRDVHKGRMHVTTINVDESVSKSGLQTGCNHCSKTQAGSEQRGGGPAAAEKPIFVDAFAEGEEVMTVTNDEASETWLRDKYKGIKFLDKDVEPEEHRTVLCLKWIRGRRSGPLARRVQRGWCVVSIMDADKHPDVDVDDDQFNESYPIGEVLWPMIRDSAVMRAKSRF